ncbi:MAG: exosortase H [Bacteroidia bacterium]|nr:exosortase H [Bacteroidia bacterium]
MAKSRAEKRRETKGKPGATTVPSPGLAERWKAFQAGKSPILIFLLKFLAVLLPFYVVWHTNFFKETILAAWTSLNANLSSLVLNLFGADTAAHGHTLVGAGASLEVFEGCDGIEPAMLLIAGIVAFPAPLKHKINGAIYGTLFILGLNFIRIISLYVVQVVWPAGFDFMHIEFWQVLFILIAVLIWAYWIKKSAPPKDVKNETAA